ncbi:hypothetical protein FB561_3228 [Kribbella amoyensis]|uniref:Uncharacterized protein n=1 Tax=Kribbella amoyensis TaxID=996641 RepID=A0A561BTE2_9ACTN|nr:hypothetical protein [Kribbella amoyensis]TWD82101.1 hypothetical protein FB561_3228 [Kribbella amoyensis]
MSTETAHRLEQARALEDTLRAAAVSIASAALVPGTMRTAFSAAASADDRKLPQALSRVAEAAQLGPAAMNAAQMAARVQLSDGRAILDQLRDEPQLDRLVTDLEAAVGTVQAETTVMSAAVLTKLGDVDKLPSAGQVRLDALSEKRDRLGEFDPPLARLTDDLDRLSSQAEAALAAGREVSMAAYTAHTEGLVHWERLPEQAENAARDARGALHGPHSDCTG